MRMIKAKKFLTTSLMIAMITIGLVSLNQAQVDKRPMITKGGKASTQSAEEREANRLAKEIRHELLTLPWYGVFDWLEGNVTPDGVVTLHGWVVRPTTKTTAEARVKDIEGVTDFKSDIKVLPLSPNDDRLRIALYREIFNSDSPIFRYALGSNPSIHLIVENGRATLKGVVSTEADKNIANVKARGVSGIFEVKNELTVENGDN